MLIKGSDIPPYLKQGSLYRSLKVNGSEEIEVPADSFKVDDSVTNSQDFVQMLRMITFWGIDKIPRGVIQYCHENERSVWEPAVTAHANLPIQTQLTSLFGIKEELPIETAPTTGRTELIEHWIQVTEPNSKYGMTATTAACKAGRLDVLQQLHKEGFRWNKYTSEAAARNGHLDCVKYLFENACPWDVYFLSGAAWNGHLDVLIFGHENGLEWSADVTNSAADMGHLECLQYLHENGCPWDYRVVTNSAVHNHLPCLQYALEHGAPIDTGACTYACSRGNLDALRLMHQHGAQLTASETTEAASYGKLDVLEYLHQQGCPWTTDATDCAARESQAHTLRYAVDNGCPCSEDIVRLAAQSGDLLCLQYLVGERGMHMNEDGSIFGTAFLRAHFECVQYLLSVDCPFRGYVFDWDGVMDVPADMLLQDAEFLKCIECAVEHGWQYNTALIEVINSCHFPLCQEYILREGWVEKSDVQSVASPLSV